VNFMRLIIITMNKPFERNYKTPKILELTIITESGFALSEIWEEDAGNEGGQWGDRNTALFYINSLD
ncbi:MAG: hypothetical protein KBS95_05780, partial [Alistipes sp.]|nr:hypothetical protein [Candidatus Alistipes equi]